LHQHTRDYDRARVRAIRPQEKEGALPTLQSEYLKRYTETIEEFKSRHKITALEKLPNLKTWCERQEFVNYLKRKDADPNYIEDGYDELKTELAAKERLSPFTAVFRTVYPNLTDEEQQMIIEQAEKTILSLTLDGNED
jgi:hypothetical protein